MAFGDPESASAVISIYRGSRHDRSGSGSHAPIFFRLLLYGVSVYGTVRIHGTGGLAPRHFFLAASQSGDRRAADGAPAQVRVWRGRCVSGGAGLQCDRRGGMFCDDVCDALLQVELRRKV